MIVPDERDVIARTLKEWCGEGFDRDPHHGRTVSHSEMLRPKPSWILQKNSPRLRRDDEDADAEVHGEGFPDKSLAVICKDPCDRIPRKQKGAARCFEAIARRSDTESRSWQAGTRSAADTGTADKTRADRRIIRRKTAYRDDLNYMEDRVYERNLRLGQDQKMRDHHRNVGRRQVFGTQCVRGPGLYVIDNLPPASPAAP